MSYDLQKGAAVERVTDARTVRDDKGADIVTQAGDVILTGPNGEVATVPARVFDAVFSESDSSTSAPSVLTPSSEPSSEVPAPSSEPSPEVGGSSTPETPSSSASPASTDPAGR